MAEEFIGPCPCAGYTVNHKDGNKNNNSANNLEWVSHLENIRHAARIGLMKSLLGSYNGNSVLVEKDIIQIRELLKTHRPSDIARLFNVTYWTIRDIRDGHSWKHCQVA